MTEEQQARYARHLVLKDIGEAGQDKLLNSSVLIIGTGGLGSPVAMYLAAAGVGTLGLADADTVDFSNLQRQIIHQTKDVGKKKSESPKETIQKFNPDVKVNTYPFFVDESNLQDIIADYDFVIDATDNFEAKFLINDACVLAEKPFCHGGILRLAGQIMTYVPGRGACYRCMFKDPPPEGAVPNGKQAGVLGAVAGTIGTLQAVEAIKYLVGCGQLLTGRLLSYDALKMEFRTVALPKDTSKCPVCGKHKTIHNFVKSDK